MTRPRFSSVFLLLWATALGAGVGAVTAGNALGDWFLFVVCGAAAIMVPVTIGITGTLWAVRRNFRRYSDGVDTGINVVMVRLNRHERRITSLEADRRSGLNGALPYESLEMRVEKTTREGGDDV